MIFHLQILHPTTTSPAALAHVLEKIRSPFLLGGFSSAPPRRPAVYERPTDAHLHYNSPKFVLLVREFGRGGVSTPNQTRQNWPATEHHLVPEVDRDAHPTLLHLSSIYGSLQRLPLVQELDVSVAPHLSSSSPQTTTLGLSLILWNGTCASVSTGLVQSQGCSVVIQPLHKHLDRWVSIRPSPNFNPFKSTPGVQLHTPW